MQLERATEGAYHLLSRWFLAKPIWKRLVPTKRHLAFHELHGLFGAKRMGCVGLVPRTDHDVRVGFWWEIRKEKGHDSSIKRGQILEQLSDWRLLRS
jgi:hypothetical protein